MATPKIKKKKIFEVFSQNLEWVKNHPSISFEPDFSNGYICPLCFDVFYEKDLDTKSNNYLTLEDIPPKSLGGKPLILTCKKCNSVSGHKLDNHLLNKLLELDSHSFLPNSKTNTTFELNGNEVNGVVRIDEEGKLILEVQQSRSDPQKVKKFNDELMPPRNKTLYNPLFESFDTFENCNKTPPFKLKFKQISNQRRAEIALLRVAYLFAYSVFGNGFYINSSLFKIREQILNPDKQIIPDVHWIKYEFPKQMEGINIITLPKELRCFLVIFRLETKSKSRQFAIVLPGPSAPGLAVYDYIKTKLCIGDGSEFLNITYEHIVERNFLKKEENAFASNIFWQEYTKSSYEPNLPNNKNR